METVVDGLVRLRLITHNRRLVDARKEKGWTQPELAVRASISHHKLHQIENLYVLPSEDEVVKLAIALEQPIDYLFPEALANAIKHDAFGKRTAELAEPQVISLIQAQAQGLLPEPNPNEVEEKVDKQLLAEALKQVLRTLLPRERRVLEIRFGLDGGSPQRLEDVGRELGVTRERVRQIEQKALRILRHPSRTRWLKDFL